MPEETKHFINGIFMCLHTGHIDEDAFWEVIHEADLKKEEVLQMILPNTDKTIEEILGEIE